MLIDVQNLSFAYKEQPVLQNLSFSIEKNKVYYLLGENGAGKTTLFRCMLGLLPFKGNILLNNTPLMRLTEKERSAQMAYIPQVHTSAFKYSVLDMVLMGTARTLSVFKSPGASEKERALDALQKLSILHLKDRDFCTLSGGEKQLVIIARALAQNARILLMDEPSSSLDYGNQIRLSERILHLSKEGYTILLSSHNPEHALRFGDQVLALKDGALLSQGTPQDVITDDLIFSLYNLHAEVVHINQNTFLCPKL